MKKQPLLNTFLAASLSFTIANAEENRPDPYVAHKKAEQPVAKIEVPPKFEPISICYEEFSVPLAMAASLQRSHPDNAALYAKLIESLEKNGVQQETFTMLRAHSGERCNSESSYYKHRLSELDLAKMPKALETEQVLVSKDIESQPFGFSLELEVTLSEDRNYADLLIETKHSAYGGKTIHGVGIHEVETFDYEQRRISGSSVLTVGSPCLVGTMNHPTVSEVNPDSAKRVSFAFITATLLK
jgi:hypothetical protein